jgi:TolA-binding protein
MPDEKNDDVKEQQTFLNEHEELLESIHSKKDTDESPPKSEQESLGSVTETEEIEVDDETPKTDAHEPEAQPEVEETPTPARKPEPAVEASIEEPAAEMLAPSDKEKPPQPHHSPHHEEVLKRQALEQSEVKEVLVFFKKYAKPAAIVLALACIFILVDKSLKSSRFKKEAKADAALMTAFDIGALQAVLDNYPSTPSGPLALMELAKEQFNAGQVDVAEALYSRFSKDYEGHELADQASLNLITCKMAKGQYADAHRLYGEFAQMHADSYLTPAALMGQARCLESLGQLEEAQIAYEDVIVNYPNTVWANDADFKLKAVLARKQ